jgi:hypothetical protein
VILSFCEITRAASTVGIDATPLPAEAVDPGARELQDTHAQPTIIKSVM